MAAVFVVFLLGCVFPAAADTFRIGVEMDSYAPHFEVREGQYSGYARELLDRYAADAGHRFEYVLLPINRLLPSLIVGHIDFRYPDNPNWYRSAKEAGPVRYSQPLAPSMAGANVLPERVGQGPLQSLGVIVGFTPSEFKAQIQSGALKRINVPKMEVLVRMAMHGRIDAVYEDGSAVRHHLKQLGYAADALVFDHSQPHSEHPFSLSTIHHTRELREFDLWLASHTDLVQQLRDQYGILGAEQLELVNCPYFSEHNSEH